MATGVDEEVAKYRKMLRNGGTIPSEEPVIAQGRQQIGKRKKNPQISTRFQTLNDFCDQSARLVDTTAQATWMILYRETKSNGVACVSHSQIAEMIGVSRRTVVRAVQHLEEAKLITVVRRGGLNGGSSSYRVHGTPDGVTPVSQVGVTPASQGV